LLSSARDILVDTACFGMLMTFELIHMLSDACLCQTMIRFIKFLIAAAADVYHDMPFAQCVHDGGTIQKQKYEAVGLQFIGARYNLLTDLQCNGLASDAPVC